ncbi:MAG: peptide chain release factor N(5)-glutamine methyltransferase [Bacteroidales bacterium]
MNSYTLRLLFDLINSRLSDFYPSTEIQSIRRLIIEDIVGIPHYQVHLMPDKIIDNETSEKVIATLQKLEAKQPIQYILGSTHFMDLPFRVNPSVLIPRPETEELVSWIIESNNVESPRILDIGTGSGCIAIALAKHLPNSQVSAIDISADALSTAQQNATDNCVDINFINTNILDIPRIAGAPFDIIVSNPPYVRELEKQQMDDNVLNFEPHLALFVKDNDPLLFYRTIAQNASAWLKSGGKLYFEINEAFGNQTKDLLTASGFTDVEIRNDINGKDRMAFGKLTNTDAKH